MEDQYPSGLNRYGQRVSSSQKVQSGVPYKFQGDPRARVSGHKGNKVSIKLNVFPEATNPGLGEDEKAVESSVSKVKFV